MCTEARYPEPSAPTGQSSATQSASAPPAKRAISSREGAAPRVKAR